MDSFDPTRGRWETALERVSVDLQSKKNEGTGRGALRSQSVSVEAGDAILNVTQPCLSALCSAYRTWGTDRRVAPLLHAWRQRKVPPSATTQGAAHAEAAEGAAPFHPYLMQNWLAEPLVAVVQRPGGTAVAHRLSLLPLCHPRRLFHCSHVYLLLRLPRRLSHCVSHCLSHCTSPSPPLPPLCGHRRRRAGRVRGARGRVRGGRRGLRAAVGRAAAAHTRDGGGRERGGRLTHTRRRARGRVERHRRGGPGPDGHAHALPHPRGRRGRWRRAGGGGGGDGADHLARAEGAADPPGAAAGEPLRRGAGDGRVLRAGREPAGLQPGRGAC
jgi:hypothetical protein